MPRGRLTAWLLGPIVVLAGCAGAPKGEGGKVFSHRTVDSGHRSTPKSSRRPTGSRSRVTTDSTRRVGNSGYRSTPDIGIARGRKFADVIPVGARITAVNVAIDGGVRAIWLSYEQNGVVSNTPRRGGDGGFTRVFELEDNEKLVSLDGGGKGGIDQLTVATNQRVKTFGNHGSGNPPSWLTDEQMRQYVGVGIIGRADGKLRLLSLRFQVRD